MEELDRRLDLEDSGEMKYYTMAEVKKKIFESEEKMNLYVVFSKGATQDIQDGYDWHEEQQPGLGLRFLNAADDVAESLIKFPYSYPSKHRNTREVRIPSFPFLMIYRIQKRIY